MISKLKPSASFPGMWAEGWVLSRISWTPRILIDNQISETRISSGSLTWCSTKPATNTFRNYNFQQR